MNEVVISLAVIFFPGIIATILTENFLSYSPKFTIFKFGVYSFVFGVSCYLVLQILTTFIGLFPSQKTFLPELTGRLDVWNYANDRETNIDIYEIVFASLIAPVLAMLLCKFCNSEKKPWLRKLFSSTKYGNENLFSHFLAHNETYWVYVRDIKNNLLYQGVVLNFSENELIQEILLGDVKIFVSTTGELLEESDRVYLSNPIGNFLIEKPILESVREENDSEAA